MLLVKEKDLAAKKNCQQKNPYGFERLYFTLLGLQNCMRNFKRLSV